MVLPTLLFCTFRLLLWDLDERRYSYYIEVSCDQQTWVRVVDKTKETCRSERLALIYIKHTFYLACGQTEKTFDMQLVAVFL